VRRAIVELDRFVGRRHERDPECVGCGQGARLEQTDAIEAGGEMEGDDHVRWMDAQLVERLDGGPRSLDDKPEPAEHLGKLAERLDLGMCHQGAEPPHHPDYIRGKDPSNG
jgi:hypothetical protein